MLKAIKLVVLSLKVEVKAHHLFVISVISSGKTEIISLHKKNIHYAS